MVILNYHMIHTIVQSENNLWTVGYYLPDGKWQPISDHSRKQNAIDMVAKLNGSKEYERFRDYVIGLLKSECRLFKNVCSRLIALIEEYDNER